MRRLLEADMKRIMTKIIPWLLLLVVWIFLGVRLAVGIGDSIDRNFFFLRTVGSALAFMDLVIGFSALLGVYGDEFKSMAMIGVIGRGISRDKFVLAKFLDSVLLIVEMLALSVIYILILKAVFGVTYNAVETRYTVCAIVFTLIEEIAYVTIAAIFYFLSENAAIGLFAYLAFELIIPATLNIAIHLSPFLKKLQIERWYVTGMCSSAYSDFILGDVGGAILMMIPAIAVYIAAMLVITMLIFRKKELDF